MTTTAATMPAAVTAAAAGTGTARWGGALAHAALAASWLAASLPAMRWIAGVLVEPGRRTNLVLLGCALVAVAALAIWRSHGRGWRPRRGGLRAAGAGAAGALRRFASAAATAAPPRLRLAPVLVVTACVAGQWSGAPLLELNVARAVACVMGTWGWVGLYVAPAAWRRALPLALLAAALLPLGEHLDALVGVPARVVTARLVQVALAPLGIAARSSEAILVLENGLADVDLPCSGVKGLWVGGAFFLLLSWIERRAVGARWLLAGAAHVAALLAANFARVLALVVVGLAAQAPDAAAMIHLPLGVVGFVGAGLVGTLALRRFMPPERGPSSPASSSPAPRGRARWAGALGLAAVLGAIPLLGTPAAARAQGVAPLGALAVGAGIGAGAGIAFEPAALEPRERDLFDSHGGVAAGKWRFAAGAAGGGGALLVVVADSFRAHHPPEVCLAAGGRRVDGVTPANAAAAAFPARLVSLDHGRATAVYWFQSRTRTTGALVDRALAEMTGGERRWAMVSVLFEGRAPAAVDAGAVAPLLAEIHAAAARALGAATAIERSTTNQEPGP